MTFDAHANFAYSTVATAPSPASSGTSLVVATGDGSKFPAVPFNATVWPANTQPLASNAEIVRVTNIATDTLTITRAQESSSARSIGIGDQIAATITAKTLTDVETAANHILFDSTLGAAAASIDTGANGVAGGYNVLEVWIMCRTDVVGATDSVDINLNGDASALYDQQYIFGTNTTASTGNVEAATSWAFGVHGDGGTANYPTVFRFTIPGYAQTSFNKVGEALIARPDGTAANQQIMMVAIGYRSTSAITRVAIATRSTAKFKAGSRLLVIGR